MRKLLIKPCIDPSEVTPITKGSNFKLIYAYKDPTFKPPLIIPLDSFDVRFNFYVKGKPEIYQASKIGNTFINCIVDFDLGIIKVIFYNYELTPGFLYESITYIVSDPDFPEGTSERITTGFTGVKLIDPV